MDTPIIDFVSTYKDSGFSRLHIPGHKGAHFLGFEEYDITEIKGADSLHEATGIVELSERNASILFGTGHSFYSTEGSSLCIKAMLYTALVNSEKTADRPVVLAARNVHRAFIHACALLDIDVRWIYPESGVPDSIYDCRVCPETLERELEIMSAHPVAVYITSPDYLGSISDISGLSEVCRRHNIPLLVDNAHGAYLKFLEKSLHPIDLGADMCCDSAHKTLPVLTGGAYLHVSKNAHSAYIKTVRKAMGIFGSTSPSYLILQSLDLCNRYLADGYRERLAECVERVKGLKERLSAIGRPVIGREPLKLVVDSHRIGIGGCDYADILRSGLVECEYSDLYYIVFMFSPENVQQDYEKVFDSMSEFSTCCYLAEEKLPVLLRAEQIMSIRKAVFSKHKSVSPKASVGKICGLPAASFQPCVPIAVSGELITEEMAELFIEYGISEIEIVCE